MLRRRKLRGPRPKRTWIFILIAILIYGAVYIVEKQAETVLMSLAKAKVKNISQEAVTIAIGETRRTLGSDLNKVMTMEETNGRPIVQVDAEVQAKVYEIAGKNIERQLKQLEQKDNGIPLGAVFQSSLFSDVGPNVPLKIWPKGSTHIQLVSSLEDAGINFVKVTLYLNVKNEMSILIPTNNDGEIQLDYNYEVTSITVPGEVPDNYYYYNNEGKGEGMGQGGGAPVPVVPVPESKKQP
ncbi:sporulation protein YunB [Melghirimyces profundicolus]|uniref:Sporulation protein YunB n=1 Tax=Melghirimyces profundicolus TaxID=1242148 RepID=A0A2T6C9K8_9BACL|nr:sporulation protein YunB [Melghirimyces profundicolus]PTX65008.1 sporulation protein YunB [Melghirimyces profundicolus]